MVVSLIFVVVVMVVVMLVLVLVLLVKVAADEVGLGLVVMVEAGISLLLVLSPTPGLHLGVQVARREPPSTIRQIWASAGWGRFDESASAEIYGQKVKFKLKKFCQQLTFMSGLCILWHIRICCVHWAYFFPILECTKKIWQLRFIKVGSAVD
jgi:hypothetical protein